MWPGEGGGEELSIEVVLLVFDGLLEVLGVDSRFTNWARWPVMVIWCRSLGLEGHRYHILGQVWRSTECNVGG